MPWTFNGCAYCFGAKKVRFALYGSQEVCSCCCDFCLIFSTAARATLGILVYLSVCFMKFYRKEI